MDLRKQETRNGWKYDGEKEKMRTIESAQIAFHQSNLKFVSLEVGKEYIWNSRHVVSKMPSLRQFNQIPQYDWDER
jgi:hypothetical protein